MKFGNVGAWSILCLFLYFFQCTNGTEVLEPQTIQTKSSPWHRPSPSETMLYHPQEGSHEFRHHLPNGASSLQDGQQLQPDYFSDRPTQAKGSEVWHLREIKSNPNSPEPLYEYAMYLLREGRNESAAQCFLEALQLSPSHAPSLCGYGALLHQVGDPRAEQLFRDAAEAGGPVALLADSAAVSYSQILCRSAELHAICSAISECPAALTTRRRRRRERDGGDAFRVAPLPNRMPMP
jgi:hypothetical protein